MTQNARPFNLDSSLFDFDRQSSMFDQDYGYQSLELEVDPSYKVAKRHIRLTLKK